MDLLSSTFATLVIILGCLARRLSGDRYVSELLERLLMDYNKNVRPVRNASDALVVKFGVNLCRLVDVDEVNQVLTTSLWLDMQWHDRKLEWNPAEWGGISKVHIPSDQIWTPDILLYNNADGDPNINVVSLALVEYTGTVFWMPPSIYKSLCPINIEYFPYDLQECFLKFGGWTNDGQTLDMQQLPPNMEDRIERQVDDDGVEFAYLENGMGLAFFRESAIIAHYFQRSAEWDLLNVTSRRYAQIYPGCCGQQYYIDIRYNITIRRKGIFFTVMLTIPCMLIANTTSFVFVVPPCEHKMTFSISVFVAFSVFYLVLIEIIPPTSLVLPLIGKYLLFTLLMITVSIIISVLNINIYRRQAFTSPMPDWQRWLFVRMLPRYLRIKMLDDDEKEQQEKSGSTASSTVDLPQSSTAGQPARKLTALPSARPRQLSLAQIDLAFKQGTPVDAVHLFRRIAQQLAVISAKFVNDEMEGKITDEWRLMALTLDRVCLILYLALNTTATVLFIWNAQSLYDVRPSLGRTSAFKPLSGDTVTFDTIYEF